MTARRELRIASHPVYAHPLPEGHRFPMAKYALIPEQLLYEGTVTEQNFFKPVMCDDEIVLWTHSTDYLDKLKHGRLSEKEQRRIGFPQSRALIEREWIITQGTIHCCHYALDNGIAMNVAGGTHHAFKDRGEGFCLLNDFGVAANYLLRKGLACKILIIDLDVHQGNGTAKLFEDDKRVFTFSMHGKHNYPFHKEKSDLDIELNDGIGDEEYLGILHNALPHLLTEVNPDFAFYLSGVDVLETDKFGKMKLTLEGCRQRDLFVFSSLRTQNIPVAVSMGGGYSPQIQTIVNAHCNTFRAASSTYL